MSCEAPPLVHVHTSVGARCASVRAWASSTSPTMYWTISPVVLATPLSKPIFYDMQHSNNAARIRLWRSLKVGMDDAIERRVVAYPDLKSPEFAAINPLKKVPAFIRADGTCVFESAVILDYLEDLYADAAPSFKPPTAEGRQLMQLLSLIHI